MRFLVYVLGGGAALAAGLLISLYWRADGPAPATSPAVPTLAEQPFEDLDGTPRTLGEWRGQVLLVNFWATWCQPCREEMPMLQRARERYRPKGVEVIGIAIDDASAVRAYRDELAIAYPLLIAAADPTEVLSRFGNAYGALPHSVVLSGGGEVVAIHTGPLNAQQLDELIGTSQ